MNLPTAIQALLTAPGIMLLLLVLAFGLIRMAVMIRRRNRREARAAAAADTAAALGWEHRIADFGRTEVDEWRGTEHDVAWRMQVLLMPPGRGNRRRQYVTRWSTNDLTGDGFVILMAIPSQTAIQLGGVGLGGAIAQRATHFFLKTYLRITFGMEGADVLGPTIPPGLSNWTPESLAGTYTAVSSGEAVAQDFLAPPVDGLFLRWLEHVAQAGRGQAGVPAALLWRGGLALELATDVQPREELQRVATLGAAICVLSRQRSAQPAEPDLAAPLS
ncbi:MAG: hypothetical protein FIB01_09160 [Gemmatimonadetes bacterium]|nr:hypothetical protein [Gemmatimonadota bacterium]